MYLKVRHVQSLGRGIAGELLIRGAEKLKHRVCAEDVRPRICPLPLSVGVAVPSYSNAASTRICSNSS